MVSVMLSSCREVKADLAFPELKEMVDKQFIGDYITSSWLVISKKKALQYSPNTQRISFLKDRTEFVACNMQNIM